MEEEATEENKIKKINKRKKQEILNIKLNEIDETINKIWIEFGIEIKFLNCPNTLEEAKRLKLKKMNLILMEI